MKHTLLNYFQKLMGILILAGLILSTFGTPGVLPASAVGEPNLALKQVFNETTQTMEDEFYIYPPDNEIDPVIYDNDSIKIQVGITDAVSTGVTYTINFCIRPGNIGDVSSICNGLDRDYYITIPPGTTRSPEGESFYVMLPELSAGDYTFIVHADVNNNVVESNETDNKFPKTFTVQTNPGSPPTNDAFASATNLSNEILPYVITEYDTHAATREPTEPSKFICDADIYEDIVLASVWYKYIPTVNTALVVDTLNSSYDTVLAVWQGTSLGSLTKVGCSDQYPIPGYPGGSLVLPYLTAGQTYYFQVAKYAGYTSVDILKDIEIAPEMSDATGLSGLDIRAQEATHGADGDLHFRVRKGLFIKGNVGLPGVQMLYEVDGNSKVATSNAGGNYSFIVPAGWTGTLTPYKAGSTFSPSSYEFVDQVTLDQVQNFITTPVLQSKATHDGWTLESFEFSNQGGTVNSKQTTVTLGDDAQRKQYRAILSFPTASLPDNAVITSVVLKVRLKGVTGGSNPLNAFGGFMVDVKRGYFGTASLLKTDFQAAATKTIGAFKPTLKSGWYTLNLSTAKTAVNKRGFTQVRLRLKLDDNNNAVANTLLLFSGNASLSSRPKLIIKYSIP